MSNCGDKCNCGSNNLSAKDIVDNMYSGYNKTELIDIVGEHSAVAIGHLITLDRGLHIVIICLLTMMMFKVVEPCWAWIFGLFALKIFFMFVSTFIVHSMAIYEKSDLEICHKK